MNEQQGKLSLDKAIELYKQDKAVTERKLDNGGFFSEWTPPTTDSPVDIFLNKGKARSGVKCYLSQCPYYNGYWLTIPGAVDCNLVADLLPGIVVDFICTKDHENCPINLYYHNELKRGTNIENGN